MDQPSTSSFKFLIESSLTPIFQRIATAYKTSLEKLGYDVEFFQPSQFTNLEEAIAAFKQCIQRSQATHFIVFDCSFLSNQYIEATDRYLFELFESSLIFIHLDNLWSHQISSQSDAAIRLEAWRRVQARSDHFCLEYKNFLDLRELGFQRVHSIKHGSEFSRLEPPNGHEYDVSFVGHVLPGINQFVDQISHLPYYHLLSAEFWLRLISFDRTIDESAAAYAEQTESINDAEFLAKKSAYYYIINSVLSIPFRGEVIRRINPEVKVDIVGGDPAYLNWLTSDRRLDGANIVYHPPTSSYTETQQIYLRSKINLNITALQFDQAVVNRVIDVAAVGGFVLTDWKADLRKITAVSEQISYKTLDELNQKIAYYLTHDEERLEIAAQLHRDVMETCQYDRIIETLISTVSAMPNASTETVCIDLGCGPYKPEGFIGVDISDRPDVDVTADLNQRFPFPDNSVDVVRAHDVVEHLSDRIHTMNEIWRICKPNAEVDIRVPSTDGRGAFQDPTHISFWNINSFKYYCIEFPPYFELCHSYGFRGAFSIVSLKHEDATPDGVIHVRAVLRAVKSEQPQPDYLNELKLSKLNFIVFPDWLQPEEATYQALTDIVKTIATSNQQPITLLINKGNFPSPSEVSLEEFLYNLVLDLFLSEGIDIANEGLEISVVELTSSELKVLQQREIYRIPLPQEHPAATAICGHIPTCELTQVQNKCLV